MIPIQPAQEPFLIRTILRVIDETHDEPHHRHEFQELLYIRSGEGIHEIDGNPITIQPNTFYLIARGQVHYFETGVDLDGFVIRFTDDFLYEEPDHGYRVTLLGHFATRHSLTVAPENIETVESLITQMAQEYEAKNFGRTALLRHLLGSLLIHLERTRRQMDEDEVPISAEAQRYIAFLNLLEEHHKQQHNVAWYAAQLAVTPRQLSDTVRRYTGETAKHAIQNRLTLEAKRYLTHTNAGVKEIAFALGYRDSSYFSRSFKKNVGVAPNAWKHKL